VIDLDRPYELEPNVALRPEPFGALAYHYGTRRLVFVRATLVRVLDLLPSSPTLHAALTAADIAPARHASFVAALTSLHASGIVRERASDPVALSPASHA